jgi:hypothetical protein
MGHSLGLVLQTQGIVYPLTAPRSGMTSYFPDVTHTSEVDQHPEPLADSSRHSPDFFPSASFSTPAIRYPANTVRRSPTAFAAFG